MRPLARNSIRWIAPYEFVDRQTPLERVPDVRDS